MTDSNTPSEQLLRSCLVCNTLIRSKNPKAKFCSPKCRVANNRQKTRDTIQTQAKTVEKQAVELDELNAAPLTQTSSVCQSNPDWQVAKKEHETQQTHCHDLQGELSAVQAEIAELTDTRVGAVLVSLVGILLVLYGMSFRISNRHRKPLDMTFWIGSLTCLMVVVPLSYWMGSFVHGQVLTQNEEKSQKLVQKRERENQLKGQLEDELEKLKVLNINWSKIPENLSETVTTTTETR